MNTTGFIDLHSDTIMVCNREKLDFINPKTHISLDKVTPGTRWAQTYAIFVPDEKRGQDAVDYYRECVRYFCGQLEKYSGKLSQVRNAAWAQTYAIFVPDEKRGQDAVDYYRECVRYFCGQLEKYSGKLSQVRNAADMDRAFEAGKFSGILAVEGGAALAGRMEMIEELAKDGVRFLTLTWNGPNEIGSGSVTHNGLSDFGREAIAEMERKNIIVDVSHLNDEGFADLCKIASKPFIATHSNSRAICGHSRNLTDAQFCEIRDRGGIVGLNYYRNFIVDGGETASISDLLKAICGHSRNLTDAQFCEIRDRGGIVGLNYYRNFIVDGGETASISDLLKHVHHFLELGGENTIALGSDFDGADIPSYLNSVEKVDNLHDALLADGLGKELTEKILFGNAYNFIRNNLK